jgi:hypothetical protein
VKRRGEALSLARSRLLGVALAWTVVACSESGTEIASVTPRPSTPTGARLLELSLATSVGGSELTPSFSPDVFDYYARCSAGINAWTVSLRASPGAVALVSQPGSPSRSAPEETVSVSIEASDAMVVVASSGKDSAEYWVRCLPDDVPSFSWVPHTNSGTTLPGYYLVGNLYPPAKTGGYALVLDSHGVPVWYQRAPNLYGAGNVDSIAPGWVSFLPFISAGIGSFGVTNLGSLMTTMVPAQPTEVMEYATNLHELKLLANGDYLVIGQPYTAGVDLTGLEVTLASGEEQPYQGTTTIQDCAIVEFAPNGTVVWSWLASEHFDPREATEMAFSNSAEPVSGQVVDVFHCNSIDIDPGNGNLLVSSRDMWSVFYVEYATGKVLWKMGGKNSSKDLAKFVEVKDPFYGQHDARLQRGWDGACNGGSGQISVFDDEYGRPGPARAVVYDVVVGAGSDTCGHGGTPGLATVVWQYRGTASSALSGSFRLSSDGSRIVGWGVGGTPLVFSEVDVEGRDLLDFSYDDGEPSYRAIKVPLSTFDLETLRRTAGLL